MPAPSAAAGEEAAERAARLRAGRVAGDDQLLRNRQSRDVAAESREVLLAIDGDTDRRPLIVWPAMVRFTLVSTVRLVKLAASVAELSVPTCPRLSVGLVEPIRS